MVSLLLEEEGGFDSVEWLDICFLGAISVHTLLKNVDSSLVVV